MAQYVSWGVSFGFLVILAKQLGADSVTLSLFTTLNLICYTAGNLAATTAVRRFGAQRMAYFSFLADVRRHDHGGLGALARRADGGPRFVLGIAVGTAYPVLMGMSIVHVDEQERGAIAMGLHQAVYAIGMFAGPWLSGILAEANRHSPDVRCDGIFCADPRVPGYAHPSRKATVRLKERNYAAVIPVQTGIWRTPAGHPPSRV